MKKVSAVNKAIGRPRAGLTPLIGFRADETIRAAIVKWAENQPDKLSLSEALRRLVELGLTVPPKSKQDSPAHAERAKELASKTIDHLTEGTPNSDEKTGRKRRLIRGPEEFRQLRVDRPRTKDK
jgi:hypothetical protein